MVAGYVRGQDGGGVSCNRPGESVELTERLTDWEYMSYIHNVAILYTTLEGFLKFENLSGRIGATN